VIAGLLVLGAMLLKVAISLSNRVIGASTGGQYYPDDGELDEWIGYRQIKRPAVGILEPGVGKGMVCVFLLAIFGFLFGIPMRLIFEPNYLDGNSNHDFKVVAHIMGLIIGFPISALVLAGMLQTRFGRACLVLLMSYLIIFALIGGLWVLIYILVGRM
jgi:hypothetical protein